MKYRREIDGLRAIAVLPVILFHAGVEIFSGGFVGVDIFFVISGYLITLIIINEKHKGTFTLVGFYERRVRRILPALFFVMFICVFFSWLWLWPSLMQEFSQSLITVTLFASNMFFWQQSGYFATANELKQLMHTWSLAVEEQYYLLFPIYVLIVWRFGQRWLINSLIVIALISLTAAHWGAYNKPSATFYLLPTRGWELLIGALAAFYVSKPERNEISPSISPSVHQSISIIGFLLIAYAIFIFDKKTPYPSLITLIPTIGTVLIILFATPGTFIAKLLGTNILVGIGLISYSAYLWHQPIFALVRIHSIQEPSQNTFILLSVLTLLLAALSWRYVEQPFRKKGTASRKTVFISSAVCALFFIVFGTFGHLTDGFKFRYAESDFQLLKSKSEFDNYVFKRADEIVDADFLDINKHKVLIIGDSYGQDLDNAMHEGNWLEHVQLSYHNIGNTCGNLFTDIDFKDKIIAADKKACEDNGWYENKTLNKLIKEADVIWLASRWKLWVVELLPESIRNIKNITNAEVLVFGAKGFGNLNLKYLLDLPPEERYRFKNKLTEETIKINEYMKNTISPQMFIDPIPLFCDLQLRCPLFTNDGDLITYDGGHVTKFGAKYYGQKLKTHPLLSKFVF